MSARTATAAERDELVRILRGDLAACGWEPWESQLVVVALDGLLDGGAPAGPEAVYMARAQGTVEVMEARRRAREQAGGPAPPAPAKQLDLMRGGDGK